MFDQEGPIEVLDDTQCWELLTSSALGRLAVSVAGKPMIFPVNYFVDHGTILIRTSQGTKLLSLTINENVAFEADFYDETSAWSVIAEGTAKALEKQSEIIGADLLPFKPWIPTLKYVYVRIAVAEISGRRFDIGPEPERY